MRQLGVSRLVLVAAPSLFAHPAIWRHFPCSASGRRRTEPAEARLTTFELVVLRAPAIEGVGIALLPTHFCREACAAGELLPVLDGWKGPVNNIHALYPSRRGLARTARAFPGFLVKDSRATPEPDQAFSQQSRRRSRAAPPARTD